MRPLLLKYFLLLGLFCVALIAPASAQAGDLFVGKGNVLSEQGPSAMAGNYLLSTTVNGPGKITSSPVGIDCGTTCSVPFDENTSVTLTATADDDARFTGWGGSCSGSDADCVLLMDEVKQVDGGFVNIFSLSVTKSGSGSGRIVSNPDLAIDCGTTCSASYDENTLVTLEALPDQGQVFVGWSGGGCSGSTSCQVTMSQAKTVNANFESGYRLSIFKSGTGLGTVTSSPAGINCGVDCYEGFVTGQSVTLSASPTAGSVFSGWSGGGCSGASTCIVTINGDTNVTATFNSVFDLTLSKSGAGSGGVTSSPAGINCGADCSETYESDQSVTLTAVAEAGSKFTGWSGGGCSGSGTCTVLMNQARAVEANFAIAETLTITKAGTGAGTITSSPVGISCGSTCSAGFAQGASVTISASPSPGSRFIGFSGEGCSGNTCTVSMNQARAVTATFGLAYQASISKTGTGSGSVTSTPSGLSCGATCSYLFDKDSVVAIEATPDPGSRFDGFSGACSGSDCSLVMSQARAVTATFTSVFTLSISKTGTGQGTVASSPAGIDCGSDCGYQFTTGEQITLTATPGLNSRFDGFSGGGCSGVSCTVTMSQARSVTATFTEAYSLQVNKNGTGQGTVTSFPAGISCGSDCQYSFNADEVVTLSANPATGSSFVGFSGEGCSGQGDCTVTVDQARSVDAEFSQNLFTFSVTVIGGGAVTSTPAGIDCGFSCSYDFAEGDTVVLKASAAAGYRFAGFSGACVGSDCVVSITKAEAVVANFIATEKLTITKTGSGSGLVTSSPSGISCGTTCSYDFDRDEEIVLSTQALPGSRFVGFSGAGCSGAGDCTVTMDQARSVAANFITIFTLSITVSGSGSVVADSAGIDCPGACSQSYDNGRVVALTPTAATGYRFSGWSGACSGSGACSVTLTQARTVTASFVRVYELTVTNAGSGSGTVTSSPSGIDCGTSCVKGFDENAVVVLTATVATGSKFTGWSGACAGVSSCTVSMSQARAVTATFTATYQLTVVKSGSGFVFSASAGISCGTDCSETYNDNTLVTLSASALTGYRFTGFSGEGCSGTGDCTVTMSQARSVTAAFVPIYLLSVSVVGAGQGAVTSSPTGIDCGIDCSESYLSSEVVTLTATPAAGSNFAGFSGACSGTGPCQVTMSQAQSVSASFTPSYALSVSKSGTGTGTVTSSPAGINCGGDCSENYNINTLVLLSTEAAPGSRFTGFSGACSGNSCAVVMSQARDVTANFASLPELSVSLSGPGRVVSTPSGIDCGSSCSYYFNPNSEVTLTASVPTGYQFAGWSGDCSGAGTCRVTMDKAKDVSASFSPTPAPPPSYQRLTVTLTGPGKIVSTPSGIDCGNNCDYLFASDTVVTLTPVAESGARFVGFAGACSGVDICNVSIARAQEVSAQFAIIEPNNNFLAYNRREKVASKSITISNKIKIPGPGLVEEAVKDTSKSKPKVRCRVSKQLSKQGIYTVSCKMSKISRKELKKKSLKLTLVVAYIPKGGRRASKYYNFVLKKR